MLCVIFSERFHTFVQDVRVRGIALLYTAGMAAAQGHAQPLIQGYSLGSLSMISYNVGPELNLPCEAEGIADLPADVPSDQTNS